MMIFSVAPVAHNHCAETNNLFVHPSEWPSFGSSHNGLCYARCGNYVFNILPLAEVQPGTVWCNVMHRKTLKLGKKEKLELTPAEVKKPLTPCMAHMELQLISRNCGEVRMMKSELVSKICSMFDQHMIHEGQYIAISARGVFISMYVKHVLTSDRMITKNSCFTFTALDDINLIGGEQKQVFKPNWDFTNMGIGGLDNEFSEIFRRAFASRLFPQDMVAELGIQHTKGILLYGPPGTGKTLIARQIGKMLNGKQPKIVNGPEILNKYFGQSEENVRNLFAEAEAEYKKSGDSSDLHIIIFDEIDAICKHRGSGSDSASRDSIVNQLLAKLDGVDSLNNILVIGMTNRKDMIDEALLRPGRMEIHVEISLPDEKGRLDIFKIHTKKIIESSRMGDVDLAALARMAKNYTGSEIAGVVRAACSFAFNRSINLKDLTKPDTNIKITEADFALAMDEVIPKFGHADSITCGEMVKFSERDLVEEGIALVDKLNANSKVSLMTYLLCGVTGSGKSTVSANIAIKAGFPFIKVIDPMVGYGEIQRCSMIKAIFEDAYRSDLSCLILDDIERLLDYTPIGPRFSNTILQCLLTLVKTSPPKGKKLFIIGTAKSESVLDSLELLELFHFVAEMPLVPRNPPIAIKKLMTIGE